MQVLQKGRKSPWVVLGLITSLIIVVFFVSLHLGVIRIAPLDVIVTLFGFGTADHQLILFEFRLPRMVIALLIGAGLAISGAILQSVSQNELAEPGIIGINSGAGLFVVIYIYLFSGSMTAIGTMSIFILPVIALLGASLSAFIIYLLAWKNGVTPTRLILVGIALNAILGAFLIVFQLKMNDTDFMKAMIWLSGSIWSTNWTYVLATLPWIVFLIPYTMYKARYLNVLHLGDNIAVSLGTNVERERRLLLATAVALAGACVAVGGGISFLGLVAPHLAKKMVGPKHQILIPTAALLGALLLLSADAIGRNILAPSELPVGIVVSALGAPYFIYLLMKSKS
ncbi:FecCD family ABC transporter permease [Brevibacillus laterosporus]|uniref:FecCD family ABC transporter permease n=1 Tax=Brevibacillus laterosporus TaxID=1465 RepID=UPI0003B1E3CA|nr:iron ABC transporter permease [Brevibacillus laterosporus]ERM18941.1 iron ABC transporter permease [Brevibacillus laterosporus PE36]